MQAAEYGAVFDSPVGWLALVLPGSAINCQQFLPDQEFAREPTSRKSRIACVAVRAFLDNPKTPQFMLLRPNGTSFQLRVWQELQDIAPGSVMYRELARRIGSGTRCGQRLSSKSDFPVNPLSPDHLERWSWRVRRSKRRTINGN